MPNIRLSSCFLWGFFTSQVGGWTQVYGDFLSYATIRGASHEAPFSQPERSLVLFKAFVGGKPLPKANGLTRTNKLVNIRPYSQTR